MKHVLLILLFCLPIATSVEAKSKQPKPKAKHVLVIGIDGWGGYSLAKAHDIPNIRLLMQQGCWLLHSKEALGVAFRFGSQLGIDVQWLLSRTAWLHHLELPHA